MRGLQQNHLGKVWTYVAVTRDRSSGRSDVRPGLLFARAGDEDGDLLYTDLEA